MGYKWIYEKIGGNTQVVIKSGKDIQHLAELDKKLWAVLACPVSGLEFSEETLNLLDSDKNGRVRVPEILSVVDYIKKYFAKPEIIIITFMACQIPYIVMIAGFSFNIVFSFKFKVIEAVNDKTREIIAFHGSVYYNHIFTCPR